jgi:phospholipase C
MNPKQKADDPIKHVVLLMFENHSFDQMLGCMKQVYDHLEGVDPNRPNVNKANGKEFPQLPTTERQMLLDPHHEVNHVAVQMKDHNGGFVQDLMDSNSKVSKAELDQQCGYVMGYYPLDFLPALHRLGREFLVCDHWFSSLPGPTWPNRFFALTGTSNGRANMPEDGEHSVDFKGWFEQDQDTIFDRLTDEGVSWKIYFHDIPQSVCLVHQRKPERVARYFPITQFFDDVRGPEADFPAFCFIEPDYNGVTENDDHPRHDVMKAQKLLADVYNAIRAKPDLWESTLLVVLYDEHGGFYDHVEPHAAVPPDNHHEEYSFDRFGIRVPALLVSPWVAQGFDPTHFDHTSLLKYLIGKWGLGPLGNRTAKANSISDLVSQKSARIGTIEKIVLTPEQLPKPDLEEKVADYVSSHQKALVLLALYLRLDFLKTWPLLYAWLTYLLEVLYHLSFKLAGKRLFRAFHTKAKQHWSKFHERKWEQAIPILAGIIRDVSRTKERRHLATETLGLVTGQHFHHATDPIAAAETWLRQAGH